MSPEDRDALASHFNALVEGEDDLGDILLGDDADDFKARIEFLDESVQKQYCDELCAQEVLDSAAFETDD